MADPYNFTFDVQAYLKEQETEAVEAPEQGVMKRPVKDAEPVVENTTDSIKTRMANALKSVFPDSTALGAAPKGDTSAGRSKALNDWSVSTEPFMPRFLGDVPASMALETPPVSTTDMGPNMDTLAMQDAQEQAAIRSASGITESLGRTALPTGTDAPSNNPVVGGGREPTKDEIKSIQQGLKKGRYYKGAVDGVLGPDTTEALRSFQVGVNLRADRVRDETRDSFEGTVGGVNYHDAAQNVNLNADGILDVDTAKYFDVDLSDSIEDVTLPSTDTVPDMYPTQGLMSPPAQDGVSGVDTSTGAPDIPEGYASSMFSGTGNNTKPVMQKVKDFADKTYSNPITAAAFSAIVEAESGTALVEDGYKKKRAIKVFVDRNRRKDGTLGPKMAARKAAIEALPEGYSGDDIFDIVYGGRMGNTEPGDGSKYKGRGLIMITGKNRYKALGDTIGVDLVRNPELLETDKDVMLRATLAYLEDKSFSTSSLSQSKLASIIGHSDDSNGTEAKKRWKRTKEIYKEMTGKDMPSRPSTIRKFTEDQSLQESLRPVLRPERSE